MDKSKNSVILRGTVKTQPEFSYETFGERFLKIELSSERKSGTEDIIPVIISEKIIPENITVGSYLEVSGRIQTYNKQTVAIGEHKTIVSVFVEEIMDCGKEIDQILNDLDDLNEVELVGYICKKPIYRTTPGGREVADVLLAVNRSYGRSYYIPCICWGRNARWASNLSEGDCLSLSGRFQSREYVKHLEEGDKTMTAYEVSASKIDIVS